MGRNPLGEPIQTAYCYSDRRGVEYAVTKWGIFAWYEYKHEWTLHPAEKATCIKHVDLINRLTNGEGLIQIPIGEIMHLSALRDQIASLEAHKH